MTGPASAHRGRRDNGLDSDQFAPIADVDPRLADHLLDVLGLRDVPAYVEPAPPGRAVVADRLFVASDRTGDARDVIELVATELGIEVAQGPQPFSSLEESRRPDPLAGVDTDAEFAAIISGLEELGRPLFSEAVSPAVHAVSTGEDSTPEAVDHFVPPAPPPIPRPSLPTAMAILVTLLGVALLAFGGMVGLPPDMPLPFGVLLIVTGAVLLVLRLRPEPRDDSDDDGAVL
ncbi:hypothetical protein M6D93_13080 [Jatrophihabitans telluris]|uniref:DUF308 domain-containing protein n=1 Tax=Jatrophihabitans telluris TaxID=2038343 RepID=A0ABY4QVS1_9ACTN|nr:hypothetical protein [Jatrophihabitans telluris]UQX87232.1 hypothetical protein M6D93_13080 [Jatrophihabitans telluris]